MPPSRIRAQAEADSRSESSSAKEKHVGSGPIGITKARRNGNGTNGASNLKDITQTLTGPAGDNGPSSQPSADALLSWSSLPIETLLAYRRAYRLDVPSAFTCAHNQYILTGPGLGAQSPTMARLKDKRRITKEQLAMHIRKDFNATGVSEQEVIAHFVYTVNNKDQNFRQRFSPAQRK